MNSKEATHLRGLRLGRHARRILLEAPEPDAEPVVLPTDTDVERNALCRAQRNLTRAGLVEIVRLRQPPGAYVPRSYPDRQTPILTAAVRLTPLGLAVRRAFGDTLRVGMRDRWTDRNLCRVEIYCGIGTGRRLQRGSNVGS